MTLNLTFVHIISVRFGLLSGHFLEKGAHSVDHMFFLYFTICNYSYFPFWFLELNLGSDCFSF